MLTHINNPNKRRAGRSTSRATIDWTSISQVTPCQCCCCLAEPRFLYTLSDTHFAADGAAIHGLQGQVEEGQGFQHEEG